MRTASTLTCGAAPLDFHTILFHRGGEGGYGAWKDKEKERENKIK